jgi:hypothetical protein
MPIAFTIDRDVIFSVAEGILSYDDIRGHIEAKRRAGIMELREIVDGRKVTVGFSVNELKSIAAEAAKALNGKAPGRIAVVVDSALAQGHAHSYSVFAGQIDSEFEVFSSIDEARAWLLNEASGS